ncbi:MAG: hypothetical protein H6741_30060 [Alphaproteobacteria bacterium]|nr:hypothetical protein [Alphaproteobacteria bacterium]
MNLRSLLLMSPLLLVACESVSSSDVLTSGMYANLSVTADGSGTSRALAILRVGGATSNTYVDLTGDDTLTVTVNEESQEFSRQALGDYIEYIADLDVDAAGTEFTIGLNRTVDEGAPASTMTLPEPFALSGPQEGGTMSRTADLTFTWEPSGESDAMSWSLSGDCFFDEVGSLDGDPGTVVVPGGTLESTDEDSPAACDAKFTLTRARTGSLDAGYGEGGKAEGLQERVVEFRSDP